MFVPLLLSTLLFGCQDEAKPNLKETTYLQYVDYHFTQKQVPYWSGLHEQSATTNVDAFDLTPYERPPNEWGEHVTGVKTRFATDEKEIALTFDACGGPNGNELDSDLIHFLIDEQIPATLFVNEQWITENIESFLILAANPLFQIENHGTTHRPLSVNGGEAWGIDATNSPEEVFAEIIENEKTVKKLTGEKMTLFRSGTAFYDEVAVELANDLGYDVVNFDILGDAGATYSSTEVKDALLQAEPGSIALLHMNQPNSGTFKGVKLAVPLLQEQGFSFVLLEGKTLH